MGAGVQRTGAGKYKLVRRGDAGVSEIETDGRGRGVRRSQNSVKARVNQC